MPNNDFFIQRKNVQEGKYDNLWNDSDVSVTCKCKRIFVNFVPFNINL